MHMVVAALVAFGALVLAWLVAPAEPRPSRVVAPASEVRSLPRAA